MAIHQRHVPQYIAVGQGVEGISPGRYAHRPVKVLVAVSPGEDIRITPAGRFGLPVNILQMLRVEKGLPIDEDFPIHNLDRLPGTGHQPLDILLQRIVGILKYDHIAPFGPPVGRQPHPGNIETDSGIGNPDPVGSTHPE